VPNDEMRLEATQLTLLPYGVSGSWVAVECVTVSKKRFSLL